MMGQHVCSSPPLKDERHDECATRYSAEMIQTIAGEPASLPDRGVSRHITSRAYGDYIRFGK